MHRPSVRRVALPLIAGAVVVAAVMLPSRLGTRAQSKGAALPSTDWPTYGHDPGGARYSPLTEITPANVSRLSVVFIGATDDSRFRAFDAKNGQELWTVKLGAAAHAVPSTYRGRDGRQYVVITSTGGGFLAAPLTDDSITAFALPASR